MGTGTVSARRHGTALLSVFIICIIACFPHHRKEHKLLPDALILLKRRNYRVIIFLISHFFNPESTVL